MVEGLTVIAVGFLVVLVMMLLMIGSVEAILAFDRFLSERLQKTEVVPVAPEAPPAKSDDGAVAAIALALHHHLSGRAVAAPRGSGTVQGLSPWATTGRLEAMRRRNAGDRRRSSPREPGR